MGGGADLRMTSHGETLRKQSRWLLCSARAGAESGTAGEDGCRARAQGGDRREGSRSRAGESTFGAAEEGHTHARSREGKDDFLGGDDFRNLGALLQEGQAQVRGLRVVCVQRCLRELVPSELLRRVASVEAAVTQAAQLAMRQLLEDVLLRLCDRRAHRGPEAWRPTSARPGRPAWLRGCTPARPHDGSPALRPSPPPPADETAGGAASPSRRRRRSRGWGTSSPPALSPPPSLPLPQLRGRCQPCWQCCPAAAGLISFLRSSRPRERTLPKVNAFVNFGERRREGDTTTAFRTQRPAAGEGSASLAARSPSPDEPAWPAGRPRRRYGEPRSTRL